MLNGLQVVEVKLGGKRVVAAAADLLEVGDSNLLQEGLQGEEEKAGDRIPALPEVVQVARDGETLAVHHRRVAIKEAGVKDRRADHHRVGIKAGEVPVAVVEAAVGDIPQEIIIITETDGGTQTLEKITTQHKVGDRMVEVLRVAVQVAKGGNPIPVVVDHRVGVKAGIKAIQTPVARLQGATQQ